MNITYQQLLDRANVLYKNKIAEKHLQKYPDLDMNKVELKFDEATEALLEALVEILNESK